MAKGSSSKGVRTPAIVNKKASYAFEILERIEAGIVLKGTEVKSLRQGSASLDEAYARVERGQVTLHHFHIEPYKQGNRFNHDPKRVKQLLLHRREIRKLASRVRIRGQTLVPLRIYFNERSKVKVQLALARGKKLHDKRQQERRRQDLRDMQWAARRRRR